MLTEASNWLGALGPDGESAIVDPQYGPRVDFSSSWMICMARIFGAPVMEPGGKVARRMSVRVVLGFGVEVMVEVAWCTELWWVVICLGLTTLTEAGMEIRARSFRMRSVIMLSSARSFSEW